MRKTRNGLVKNLPYLCLIGVIAFGLISIVGSNGGDCGGGDADYRLTTEEELLHATQNSPEFNDTLNYARELGYNSPIKNVIKYDVTAYHSLFSGIISNSDAELLCIIFDQRPQPFILPAFLVMTEDWTVVSILSRNGGLSIDTSSSTSNPIIASKPFDRTIQYTTCIDAFENFLNCVNDGLSDVDDWLQCIVGVSLCLAQQLYMLSHGQPLDIHMFAMCLQQFASEACIQATTELFLRCADEEIFGTSCEDGIDCTDPDTCNYIAVCDGPMNDEYCDYLDTECENYSCSKIYDCYLYDEITQCINDDNCCPNNCTYIEDNDCEEEIWIDPISGLMWQNSGLVAENWNNALQHCEQLSFANYDDWHLPSISELRSLVKGCPDTETGGACDVTDDCLSVLECWYCLSGSECSWPTSCSGCEYFAGPDDGCYRDSELEENCDVHWSSSPAIGGLPDIAYSVIFQDAGIEYFPKSWSLTVRCVR
jgi:hypothetical protein